MNQNGSKKRLSVLGDSRIHTKGLFQSIELQNGDRLATDRRKCLLDRCDDWKVSADLPKWDSHPSIIKETRLRSDVVIHSSSTQLTIQYESKMEEAHAYTREKNT